MKKIFLSSFLIFVFTAHVIHQRITGSNETAVYIAPPAAATATEPAAPLPAVTNSGGYRDGTYTGKIADAYYGSVQVKVTVSDGKISDIQFLDYPHDRNNSVRISAYAMPLLKQEAIQTQKADVDAISGATATSGGFNESLASALAPAKN